MPIAIMFIVVAGATWKALWGLLLASGVFLLSGYQDIGLRARIGAAFGFFMALVFGISALATAIWTKLWGGAAICAVVLCFETWFVLRWRSRRT